MKAKAKIVKAECHAQGVTITRADQVRTGTHFDYRDFAFTPEIREHNARQRNHTLVPLTTAVLPKGFTLTRRTS